MSAGYIPVKVEDWAKMVEATKVAADLLVENKRLRKAGDAVACCLEAYWKGKPYDVKTTIKCFDAWLAAKEGGAK